MAWTQTDVDQLKTAIASGATSVGHGDKRVTYRSLDEMRQTLAMMVLEVSGKKGPVVHFAGFSRGTGPAVSSWDRNGR